MCDGLERVEEIVLLRRLKDNFPHEDLNNAYEQLEKEFKVNFTQSVENLRGEIKRYSSVDKHKDKLISFARSFLSDDGKLTEREIQTIEEIEEFLK
tara:strand:- start:104 stop:391 length:288 start_codon:yes stop_codon:yes gene_type:complete